MFFKKEKRLITFNEDERILLELPYCSCNACIEVYSDLKTKIDKNRFNELDSARLSRFFSK